MSPAALHINGHHDSFSVPNGSANQANVHPSARRAPAGGLIKVDSDNTVYEDGGIKARYTDRGADVVSE
jgi:myo-inositol-1-phosphate synthase